MLYTTNCPLFAKNLEILFPYDFKMSTDNNPRYLGYPFFLPSNKDMTEKEDMVEKPPHYQVGGIETVDVIKAKLGGEKSEHWHGYLLGNIIKYTTRAKYKGNFLEDLQKARYYLNVLIEDSEK